VSGRTARVEQDSTDRYDRPAATVPLPNALAYGVALMAFVVAAIQPFAVLDKGLSFTEASNGYFLHNAVPFAVLGALILWRRPGHAIGWVLVLIGGLDAFTHIGDEYELFEFGELAGYPSVLSVEQVVGWLWVPVVALVGMALPQLFPDGRLLSRRWRPLAGFCAVATAVLSVLFIMDPTGNGMDPVLSLVFPAYGLAMLLSLVPLFTRFRRTSGVERQQLKWVFYGLAVSVPLLMLGTAGVTWGANAAWSLPALVILPASITVAVLRYRLFDVDVVISRTLLVAGLAGFITVAYVGIVVGVGSLIGQGDEPDLVLSVLATALVAVAFQPIRRGLQRVANRLVFGRRATPYDVLSGFATRVGAAEPSSDTLVQLAELMAGGTGADPARVWLRVGTQLRPAATWPPVPAGTDVRAPAAVEVDPDSSTPSLPDVDLAVPVREQGELLGMLTIAKPRGERVTEIDSELLGRLAAASGVVLRNLRLDAELAQRLTDLEASRRRLLSAQNDARQRIEADLAGGSRAQLCVLRDRLSGLARDVDLRATPKTSLLLGQLVAATDGALETLDGLAAGVYPPRLAADGLGSALTEQAAKAALPISVHAAGVGRYPAEVEAAVYFGVLEALQNVAKYATASSAQVRLRHDRDRLLFEVTDDGVGFDPSATRLGTGLQGMADRLDTVGGRLTVDSTPGAGTAITGEVPVVLAPPPRDLEAALVGGSQ